MPTSADPPAPAPSRARVLAALVGVSVLIGLLAGLDSTTLRPGPWTVAFHCSLATGGLSALGLLTLGRRWSDRVLVVLITGLMGLVVLSVLANQSRAGGMLNVVLLLPNAVFAAVYLSRGACRVVSLVLTLCLAVVMRAVTAEPLQWTTLVALPLLAFVGTSEVVLRLRGELESAATALRRQSLTDPLTGLSNRRALQEHLAGSAGTGTCTVLALDIDHFKAINDTHGHAVGDEVLRCFSAGLARETRHDDVVVRMGGEEFLVLSSTPVDRAEEFAQTLRTRAAHWMAPWSATVSVGVVTVERPERRGLVGSGLQAAIERADVCLYAAKQQGRNRVVTQVWPEA
ncbi:GGDEF domain-containing protein [Kineococcus sp. NBC_00420]|uniref:GGDEF domain-containing protein n=1 Tax=unclassified Kineococcus TaxID=2621656 RepID=UPI002E23C79E